jgi:folate-binding protein YgfZ
MPSRDLIMTTLKALADLPANLIIEATHFGAIQVTGPDTATYLHGQVTVDVNKLEEGKARNTAHCDFKGKAWSLGWLLKQKEKTLLLSHQDGIEASLGQLNKYGVFSKIDIVDASSDLCQFYTQGPELLPFITAFFGAIPQTPLATLEQNDCSVIKLDYPTQGYWLVLDQEGKSSLLAFCQQHTIPQANINVLEAIAINAGVPQVSGDNIHQFVPQMMNMQALDGIDFNKGCYMGQEVIARTRYLGKNKRAAFALLAKGSVKADVGDTLERRMGDNWRRGGTIIRAAVLDSETWLLAILPNDTTMEDELRLTASPEVIFTPQQLPYTIE